VKPCVVEYKNKPVGYIQYYDIQENDLKRYGYPQNLDIYGIDQFIGEAELWGKGIGTSMIFLMLNYLSNHKNATRVVLEVKNHNMRAIFCYKKCGFRKIKDINDDISLMEWEK
jgi:aminoglycoside 6'-N-acetyltransferase